MEYSFGPTQLLRQERKSCQRQNDGFQLNSMQVSVLSIYLTLVLVTLNVSISQGRFCEWICGKAFKDELWRKRCVEGMQQHGNSNCESDIRSMVDRYGKRSGQLTRPQESAVDLPPARALQDDVTSATWKLDGLLRVLRSVLAHDSSIDKEIE